MNVSLTQELDEYVAQQVASGRYRTASEFIRECVRTKMDNDEERALRMEALRRDVAEGVEALERGDWVDGPTAFERVRQQLEDGGTA